MKKANITIATLVALASIGAADAATTQTTIVTKTHTYSKESDNRIAKTLGNKIDHCTILDDEISFSVRDGVVTLRGTVDDQDERNHAAMMAKEINGVIRVDNAIEID